MSILSIPDTTVLKKSLLSSFSIRDGIYVLCLAFMMMNQHFSNEARIAKLEDSNVQLVTLTTKMSIRMDNDMVPRKEHDSTMAALEIRLGNIETGQRNIMTYMLDHKAVSSF